MKSRDTDYRWRYGLVIIYRFSSKPTNYIRAKYTLITILHGLYTLNFYENKRQTIYVRIKFPLMQIIPPVRRSIPEIIPCIADFLLQQAFYARYSVIETLHFYCQSHILILIPILLEKLFYIAGILSPRCKGSFSLFDILHF